MTENSQAQDCSNVLTAFLAERSVAFKRLKDLREQGWNNPDGDLYFRRQRQSADRSSEKTAFFFFKMMQKIGKELHDATDAFQISRYHTGKPKILDFCAAPGGFLGTALAANPEAEVLAYSLPASCGGHRVLLPKSRRVKFEFLDITLLATDMGITEIPETHPEARLFLPRSLDLQQRFDLVICDGQVLRTHARASYREMREARRLIVTQLALGLEHVRCGGKMIILLHRIDVWDTATLLYEFSKFSAMQVVKPISAHRTRSSFYLVASDIQSESPEALQAITAWKNIWKAATFASDEEYMQVIRTEPVKNKNILRDYGSKLLEIGEPIWTIQADALARAPYIANLQ